MPALRFTAVAVTAVLAAAAAPAAVPDSAHASRYLSRAQASNVTKRFALRYVDRLYSARKASCWPTGRRHTSRNLRYAWTRWDCGWSIRVHDADGSIDRCSGKLRVTGLPRGARRRTLRKAQCVQVKAPTPAAGPTPDNPGPGSPQPGNGLTSRQQQMREAAINYGIGYAQNLIDNGGLLGGALYYGQINRPECVLLNATKVRCPMFLWWEDRFEPSPFHYQITREIYRANVYAEDLGTSVGFNTSIEPQSILSYDPFHPFRWLCSNRYAGLPACPASRTPIAYPTSGPPYPNPQ